MSCALTLHAATVSAAQDRESRRVIVGTELAYPPYSLLDENGEPSGYNVDLTRAIAEVMGLDVELRMAPWAEIRSALETGKIDVISGMYYSRQRDELVDFSPPYTVVHHAIFARRGSPEIVQEQELRGKEIIVMRGDIMHDYVLEQNLSREPVLMDTQADVLRLLASGRHDYAVVAKLPGLYWVRELGLSNVVVFGPLMGPSEYSFAVSHGNTELLSAFEQGLAIIKQTGRYREICEKWLGVLEPHSVPAGRILNLTAIILVPLVILLGGSVLWSRSLQRRVTERTLELRAEAAERKEAQRAMLAAQQELIDQQHSETERIKAELDKARDRLVRQTKLAAVGQVAGSIAHELRNPLGAVRNAVYYLKRYATSPDPETREHLEIIDEELHAADRIITDLMHMVRSRPVSKEPVDLELLIEEVFERVQFGEGIRWSVKLERDSCTLDADPSQLRRVLENLVANAAQAMESTGGEIEVEAWCCDDYCELTIRDTGPGVAAEHRDRLFEPLFTTKAKGTGLGLSICRDIMERHGGSIELMSGDSSGAAFLLRLPRRAESAPRSPESTD